MVRHAPSLRALRALAAVAVTATVTSLLSAPSASAAPTVWLSSVLSGLSKPTQVTHAGDGTDRLFVTEQRGTIRVVQDGRLLPGYFLDIRSRISTGGERGLLGLAFHPDFSTNRFFYVYYTRTDGDIMIARYTANPDRASAPASSERRVLYVEHSAASNHNGGGIAFGPNGYLYAGIGDGGGAGDPEGDSRSLTRNLLGKVIRINVDGTGTGTYKNYSIPSTNPYRGARTGRDEIWARGLRNPWRISFDRGNGALYIADVGQNQREEVNRETAASTGGRDYGWNIMEGRTCYRPSGCPLSGDSLPVMEYSHSGGNCSITGGYVYRGAEYPALRGHYLFGDFCSGRIWTIPTSGTNVAEQLAADTPARITSFGEDEDGELYLVTAAGTLYRIRM